MINFKAEKEDLKDFKESVVLSITRDATRFWLQEAYQKTDVAFIKDFVKSFYAYLDKQISEESFENIQDFNGVRILFIRDQSDEFFLDAKCRVTDNEIVFLTNWHTFKRLLDRDKKYRHEFSKGIQALYVHEDTHRQQFKKYSDLKGYKTLDYNDAGDLDYYDQYIEADAYGRQVGQMIRSTYPEESLDHLYKKIGTKTLPYNIQQVLNTYQSSDVSKRNKVKFMRTLYDYLSDQEIDN